MSNEYNPIEKDTQLPQEYISLFMLDDLKEANDIPPYLGEGETSYVRNYLDKIDYINSIGIEIPPRWISDEPMVLTSFIVAGKFAVIQSMLRDGISRQSLETFITAINSNLEEKRVDRSNVYRQKLENGLRTQEYFRKLGLSANSQRRVNREELKEICNYVFTQLTKKE